MPKYGVSFWVGDQAVAAPAASFLWKLNNEVIGENSTGTRLIKFPQEEGVVVIQVSCFTTGQLLSATLKVTVIKRPVIQSSGGDLLPSGATFQLSTGDYDSYEWSWETQLISTNKTVSVSQVGNYHVKVTRGGLSLFSASYTLSRPAALTGNYILSNSAQVPAVPLSGIGDLPADQNQRQVQYFDGLGRPSQSISIQGAVDGRDLVQPIEYDAFGREAVTYLPYVAPKAGGAYRPQAFTGSAGGYASSEHSAFYNQADNNTIAHSTTPYAVKVFEPSPLNRVIEQGAPGDAWQPTTGASVKEFYETNKANEVINFQYETGTGALTWLNANNNPAYYTENRLHTSRVLDENNVEQITFTDKEGRIVLKRSQYSTTSDGKKLYADTYYVYNISGNLMYVLPPEAVSRLLTSLQPH